MSKRSRWFKPHGSWLGSLLVAVIVGGITYGVYKDQGLDVVTSGATQTTSTVAVTPDRIVYLSIAKSDGTTNVVSVNTTAKRIEPTSRSTKPVGSALRVEPSEDGVSRIVDGNDWNVALRASNGAPFVNARIVSELSPSRVVVIGSTDGDHLLYVERSGSIRDVYALPPLYVLHGLMEGVLWISTAEPGEGIESPPQGPSAIIRITSAGVVETRKSSPDAVSALAVGPANALAYMTENGNVIAESGSSSWNGTGRPLMWVDVSHLLVARGQTVSLVDLETKTQQDIGDAGGIPVAALPEE